VELSERKGDCEDDATALLPWVCCLCAPVFDKCSRHHSHSVVHRSTLVRVLSSSAAIRSSSSTASFTLQPNSKLLRAAPRLTLSLPAASRPRSVSTASVAASASLPRARCQAGSV